MGFVDMNALKVREMLPGLRARFVHTGNMTFSYWNIDAGAVLPEHSHPHEQVANMLEGEFELTVNGESKRMLPGDVCVIPPNARHSGRAFTDCRVLDVFHPVREDYR
ncbi:MAG: cupin domain-containing protein [Desulfococcaceae bacterium]